MRAARRAVLRAAPGAAALGVALGASLGASPGASGAQPAAAVVVRVVDAVTGRPLANADVVDLRTGAARLTDARGEARLAGGPAALRLRVRQIGYRPFEPTAGPTPSRETPPRSAAVVADTVTVALERVAFRLPGVVATAASTCPADTARANSARAGSGLADSGSADSGSADAAAGALAADVLRQIRTAAERYHSFRRAYPFRVHVQRRSAEVRRDGTAPRIVVARVTGESDRYDEPYEPGALVRSGRAGFSVPVLFVTALADSAFLARHCFGLRGVVSLGPGRVVRLDFAPARGVRDAEWAGALFVDSATSLLRRVEFRLANLAPRDAPARLEGYVAFSSPSPYVVLPESTFAAWWRTAPEDRAGHAWGPPDAVQLLQIERVEYRKARPPAPRDSAAPAAGP